MIKDVGKYFLYRHIRHDKNVPFYIGVGTKRKDRKKGFKDVFGRAFDTTLRSQLWKRIYNKTSIEVEILFETDDLDFLSEREAVFIKLYGQVNTKTGTLANLNDGGPGSIGVVYSKERRLKASSRLKGRKLSPEIRLKMSLGARGRKKTLEHRARLSVVGMGKQNAAKRVEQYTLEGVKVKEWNSFKGGNPIIRIGASFIFMLGRC